MKSNGFKEYGGYLPIETYLSNNHSHFFDSDKNAVVKLNCGRSCFYTAARSVKIKKIYVPFFTCIETAQPFKDLGIPVSFYQLDESLMPRDINLMKDEFILWTNYYGNASDEMISFVEKKYRGQLIVDNCHAFFCEPIQGALNCYSARKFIGVSDGAYLVTDIDTELKTDGLVRDTTSPFMQHLFKQVEEGTNKGYEINLQNEKRLEKNYGFMSVITERILNLVNYEEIKNIREKNFFTLHSFLGELNDFPINTEIGTQMYYPFKCKDRDLKQKLIKEKVYNPTWWIHVVSELGYDSIEAEYALETTLIPVDQRYSLSDMEILSDLVKNLIEV